MKITGTFERFQYLNFATSFLENKNVFQKTGALLLETNKIENASFPSKTVMSEANVKTNRVSSTK